MIVGLLDDSQSDVSFIYRNGKFYHPIFILPNGAVDMNYVEISGVNGYGEISGGAIIGLTFKPFIGNCSF